MQPLVPEYGTATLANVVPSILAGLDVPGMTAPLGLPHARKACLLLVDGLGWELLRAHESVAPFLSSLAGRAITAGFPATTATSITSIGTGLPPGEHGIVGYTFAADKDILLNALGWYRPGEGKPLDLRSRIIPEEFQPHPTALERAAEAGVAVSRVTPHDHDGSGLTRAALRGGQFLGVHALGDLTTRTIQALNSQDRAFCYTYHADLDLLGHVYGPGSDPWCQQLAYVDHLASTIAGQLPRDGLLVITGDHGMVEVTPEDRVDLDTETGLNQGVRMLGGEARVRHVYTEPGATEDVLAAWRERLGDRAWILRRDEAVAAGWFGPEVAAAVRPRIGDLVVAAQGSLAMTSPRAEPHLSRLPGQHGSLTPDEQLVPLLVFQPA